MADDRKPYEKVYDMMTGNFIKGIKRRRKQEALGLEDAESAAERRKKADAEPPATLQSDGVYR